jgi:tetratricopeptide (TPR) repeat protein
MLEVREREAQRRLSVEAFNDGVRAIGAGDVRRAGECWTRAGEMEPVMDLAFRNLASLYENAGELQSAAYWYDRLIAVDPFDTRWLIRRATISRRAGHIDDAITLYDRAIAIYPYFAGWYLELAALYDQQGTADEAALWRDRAARLGAEEAEGAYSDGIRHMREGSFALAQACFEALLDEFPGNIDARLNLATAYARQGRYDRALEELGTALELTDRASGLVHYRRARILIELNRIGEAQTDLEFAIDHTPAYGRAREMLRRLTGLQGDGGAAAFADYQKAAKAAEQAEVDASAAHRQATKATAAITAEPSSSQNGSTGFGDQNSEPAPASKAPALKPLDPALPWFDQVRQAMRHACALPSPGGQPPRVAVLIEPFAPLSAIVGRVLHVVSGPELPTAPNGLQPIFVAEAEARPNTGRIGLMAFGWYGSDNYPEFVPGRWDDQMGGAAIDSLLDAARMAAGDDGFNLVVIVSSGRVRADQTQTVGLLRRLPAHQIVHVAPTDRASDLAVRMQGIAPNWQEIIVG